MGSDLFVATAGAVVLRVNNKAGKMVFLARDDSVDQVLEGVQCLTARGKSASTRTWAEIST